MTPMSDPDRRFEFRCPIHGFIPIDAWERDILFTQVYFHRTRVAYDHHLREALAVLLPDGTFPPPTADGLAKFQKWDDWRVLGLLADGQGGEHGQRLASRDHYREVYHTPETPTGGDLERLERVRTALGDKLAAVEPAGKSWYKLEKPEDILVAQNESGANVKRLSEYSSVVRNLTPNRQVLLYSRPEHAEQARQLAERA
jgi:HD superfamily phosphohydrolase